MNGKERLEEILKVAMKKEASDIHLKAGIVPVIRRFGKLRPLSSKATPLDSHQIDEMAFGILDENQKEAYRENKQIDLGFGVSGLGRFRVNIFRQRGTTRLVIRNIPMVIPKIADLGLPESIREIAEQERGLILVTGATGEGKSTTLASMLDHINRSANKHIITIEDPIEYLIRDRKSIISQREIGTDSTSFKDALRSALRQDPDIILIGEMRDQETVEIALTAAETGHLVLSTLHTQDASEAIHRILSVFPPHQHAQIRYQLASVLKSVISQRLVRKKEGDGFVPAIEILINNPRVAELIEEPKRTSELNKVIAESANRGMQTFDQSLMSLVRSGLVTYEEALECSTSPEDFQLRYSGVSAGDDKKKWESDPSATSVRQDSWHQIKHLEIETAVYGSAEEDEEDEESETPVRLTPRVIKKVGK